MTSVDEGIVAKNPNLYLADCIFLIKANEHDPSVHSKSEEIMVAIKEKGCSSLLDGLKHVMSTFGFDFCLLLITFLLLLAFRS